MEGAWCCVSKVHSGVVAAANAAVLIRRGGIGEDGGRTRRYDSGANFRDAAFS